MIMLPGALSVFIGCLVISAFIELWLPHVKVGPARLGLTIVALFLTMFGAGTLVTALPSMATIILVILALYRVINQLRAAEGRLPAAYLTMTVQRSGIVLIGLQIVVLLAYLAWRYYHLVRYDDLLIIAWGAITVGVSLAVAIHSWLELRAADTRGTSLSPAVTQPTVSVLVPARNETQDLNSCLDALIASDYPKLEIIVLDDCSQDKTPEIIKHYANKGVRFIPGNNVPLKWLAKNYAYSQLVKQASGQLLLFMGVDVRVAPTSISKMVSELSSNNLTMVSILPIRKNQQMLAGVVQPTRYWWELALPRRVSGHPPVLSTCWMVSAKALKRFGGLDAVRHAVIPETYFARQSALSNSYKFIYGGQLLGVSSIKPIGEQLATAIRTRYPQQHRSLWRTALVSLGELVFLLGPFIVLAVSTLMQLSLWAVIASALAALLLTAGHVHITLRTSPGIWWLSIISFPFVVLVEVAVLQLSMYRYELGEVSWKGRNICMPVMLQHLPTQPGALPLKRDGRKPATVS